MGLTGLETLAKITGKMTNTAPCKKEISSAILGNGGPAKYHIQSRSRTLSDLRSRTFEHRFCRPLRDEPNLLGIRSGTNEHGEISGFFPVQRSVCYGPTICLRNR